MNIQGKKNCFEVHIVPIGTQYGMKVVILCRLFLCVLHAAAFFFKDSKPITRKDVISPDNRTQYCTFTAEMCIRVYTCGGHLNQRSGWDVGLSMLHGWVIFLSGVWFLLKTDQTLTCDLDLDPHLSRSSTCYYCGKKCKFDLVFTCNVSPFTLWRESLTLTHFWVIQGQHSCYRNLSPLSMSPLSLCGRKSLTFDLDPFLGHSRSTLLLQYIPSIYGCAIQVTGFRT